MSSESVCQVARSWVDVGSFHKRLFIIFMIFLQRQSGIFWIYLRRWQDNIKMDLQEVGCGGMDWIELAQDSARWREIVNAVMNLRVT
jgi:hypothetical protein